MLYNVVLCYVFFLFLSFFFLLNFWFGAINKYLYILVFYKKMGLHCIYELLAAYGLGQIANHLQQFSLTSISKDKDNKKITLKLLYK